MIVTAANHNKIKGQNLKRLRTAWKLTLEQVAERAKSSGPYLCDIENGKRGMGTKTLIKLCNAFNVNAAEFTVTLEDDAGPLPIRLDKLVVISLHKSASDGKYRERGHSTGVGVEYIDRAMDIKDPNAYAVRVMDDAMSPRYEPGDIIVISPSHPVEAGNYVYVKLVVSGEVLIRRIQWHDDLTILIPVNPSYALYTYKPEEIVFVHKIVWKKEK